MNLARVVDIGPLYAIRDSYKYGLLPMLWADRVTGVKLMRECSFPLVAAWARPMFVDSEGCSDSAELSFVVRKNRCVYTCTRQCCRLTD